MECKCICGGISNLLGLISGVYGLWNHSWLWIIIGAVLLVLGHIPYCCCKSEKPARKSRRKRK